MSTDLLEEGLRLMFIGMGVVFLYLGLLVVVIKAISALVQTFESGAAEAAPAKPVPAATGGQGEDTVAAITSAVHKYRSDK